MGEGLGTGAKPSVELQLAGERVAWAACGPARGGLGRGTGGADHFLTPFGNWAWAAGSWVGA